MNDEADSILEWLKTEKYYQVQFELWKQKLSKPTKLTWFGGLFEDHAIVLKFGDQVINITVPHPTNNNDETIFFVSGKSSWDTFVNDFILNHASSFNDVLSKLMETINHYYRKNLLQSGGRTQNTIAEMDHSKEKMEYCGKAMLRLEPIVSQALTVLKEEQQYRITLDSENNEWIFRIPIHDVISPQVAKAIILEPLSPITIVLKLQLKFDGTGTDGELSVIRVEAYQNRSGRLNVQLKDMAWDFIEKIGVVFNIG